MNGTSESGQGSDQLTYEIIVTNNGPAAATGVALTDTLPAGLSFGSMTASQGSCTPVDPRTMTCTLGNLASGASAIATLVGTPTTTATITNTTRVTAAEFDPDLSNNSTSQGIGVDFIWFRRSEISGYDDHATVAVDTSGVYLATADAEGLQTTFLIKYDTSGTEVWRHEFATDRSAGRVNAGVAADTSGVYTIGATVISGIYDTLISKFDAHGAELWTHQFDGSSHNFPADIAVAAGGIYVVGNPAFGASISPFVRAYDTSGTELWTASLAGFFAHSIAADASGVYVFHTISGSVISKYDVNGNAVWTSPVAGFTGGGGRTNSVLAVDAGGVYVASNGSPAFVRKYDKDGGELWTRLFEMWNSSPAVASDGSTVYVGGINPPGIAGLIRTYDVDGNELSAHVLRFGEIQTGVQDFAVGCAGVFAAGHTSSSTFVSRPIDTFVMKLSTPALPCHPDAPTVSATSPLVVVNEGQVGRNSGIYANAATNEPVGLSASVGTLTKTGTQDGSWEWSFNTTDGPAQSQVVTITADDGQGEISTALFELIVHNVAPTEKITGAPTSSPAGTPINLNSTVTDGGGADSGAGFTYAWTVTREGQSVASGSESSFSFTPNVGGDYQVTLRVTDKDGGTSVNTVTIVVVQTNRPPTCTNVAGSLCYGLGQGAYAAANSLAMCTGATCNPVTGGLGYLPAANASGYNAFAGDPNATTIGVHGTRAVTIAPSSSSGGTSATFSTDLATLIAYLPTTGAPGSFDSKLVGLDTHYAAPSAIPDLSAGGSKGQGGGTLAGQAMTCSLNSFLSGIPGGFMPSGFGGFTLPATGTLVCTKRAGSDKMLGTGDDICEAFSYQSCVAGKAVSAVLAAANQQLALKSNTLGCTASQLSTALNNINVEFDQGGTVIVCPAGVVPGTYGPGTAQASFTCP
jgi:uncharacterized repeat protein (TIGR01451 family)